MGKLTDRTPELTTPTKDAPVPKNRDFRTFVERQRRSQRSYVAPSRLILTGFLRATFRFFTACRYLQRFRLSTRKTVSFWAISSLFLDFLPHTGKGLIFIIYFLKLSPIHSVNIGCNFLHMHRLLCAIVQCCMKACLPYIITMYSFQQHTLAGELNMYRTEIHKDIQALNMNRTEIHKEIL